MKMSSSSLSAAELKEKLTGSNAADGLREMDRRRTISQNLNNTNPLKLYLVHQTEFRKLDTCTRERARFVIFNKAHQQEKIHCDGPMVRVLGFFKTEKDVARHQKKLRKLGIIDKTTNESSIGPLYCVPVNKFTVVNKNQADNTNVEYITALQSTVLRAYDNYKIKCYKDLLERIDQAKENNGKANPEDKAPADREEDEQQKNEDEAPADKAEADKQKEDNHDDSDSESDEDGEDDDREQLAVPRNAELRGQTHALIGLVKDMRYSDDDSETVNAEPVVIFFGGFDSKESAQTFYENRIKKVVLSIDIYVVDMYEFFCPQVKADHVLAQEKKGFIDEKHFNPEMQGLLHATRLQHDDFDLQVEDPDGDNAQPLNLDDIRLDTVEQIYPPPGEQQQQQEQNNN